MYDSRRKTYVCYVFITSLQENSLGMDGAIFIATALKGNHQLTYIKWVFSSTPPLYLHVQYHMCMCVCLLQREDDYMLSSCSYIPRTDVCFFSLQGNGIGESGAKVISDAIRANAPGCVVDIWSRRELLSKITHVT